MMVLEIVIQHLEDDLAKGEEIFICFEILVFLGKPIIKYLGVDSPDDVIKDVRNTGHNMLKNAYNFLIERLVRLYFLDDGRDLVDKFEELEDFP
jgi:hypothetical protein